MIIRAVLTRLSQIVCPRCRRSKFCPRCRDSHHLFGTRYRSERFLLPPEAEYEYVVAAVQVERPPLQVTLGADPVAEFPYRLR
jgi:hypothetical protein